MHSFISYFNFRNNSNHSSMSVDCKLRIIIILLCFIIFYLFFITIVGLSLIFGMLVNWSYVYGLFDLYSSNIDYLKDVLIEKPFDLIRNWIYNDFFTKERMTMTVADKMAKERKEGKEEKNEKKVKKVKKKEKIR